MKVVTREVFPSFCRNLLNKIQFSYTPFNKSQFNLFVNFIIAIENDEEQLWGVRSLAKMRKDYKFHPSSLFTPEQNTMMEAFWSSIEAITGWAGKRTPAEADTSDKIIISRYQALYQTHRHVEHGMGSAIYSKDQYNILIDFLLALKKEMAETIKLSEELSKIWNDLDDSDERWQDETLGKIIYTIRDDIKEFDKYGFPKVQKAAAEFWQGITDESLRLRKKLHGNCSRCGRVNERNRVVTLYFFDKDYNRIKPDEVICSECDWDEKIKMYEEHGELTSTLVTQAHLHKEFQRDKDDFHTKSAETLKKIVLQCEEITAATNKFEEQIWVAWLQKFMDDSKERRFSANSKHLKVLAFSGLGRVLITIQDQFPMKHKEGIYNGGSISLIVSEDSKTPGHMGWQGIAATKEEAIKLLEDAIKLTTPETLKYDKDVSYMGM